LELFNAGQFFLAHEALEEAWFEASANNRRFVQGMVQLAVAFHHYGSGNLEGARGVLARAVENLQPYPDAFGGIDMRQLWQDLACWTPALPEPASQPKCPVLHWDERMIQSDFP
jgi:hypothetical protein